MVTEGLSMQSQLVQTDTVCTTRSPSRTQESWLWVGLEFLNASCQLQPLFGFPASPLVSPTPPGYLWVSEHKLITEQGQVGTCHCRRLTWVHVSG